MIKIDWATGKVYLKRIPADGDIPARHVLVHNHVRPTRVLGSRGFRAWIQAQADNRVRCDCGWAAGKVRVHYRVRRDRKEG